MLNAKCHFHTSSKFYLVFIAFSTLKWAFMIKHMPQFQIFANNSSWSMLNTSSKSPQYFFVNQIYLSPKEELWKKTLCTAKLKYLLKIKHIPSYFIQIWLHLPIHWAHSFKSSDFFLPSICVVYDISIFTGKKTMHVKRC